jgi:hypothetical protein
MDQTSEAVPPAGSSYALYNRMYEQMKALCSAHTSNSKPLSNCVWLVVGVLGGRSISLAELALFWPGDAEAASRVTRIRRWLKNPHVNAWALYRAVLQQVLKGWRQVELTVVLDGTLLFGDRWQVFRLSFVHGCRAIPLWWVVVPGKRLVQCERLTGLFAQVAAFLAPSVRRVTCLADRGFRDHDWAALCLRVGWNYRLRVARNTTLTFRSGQRRRIDRLGVRRGRILCLHDVRVRLTLTGQFPTHLSVAWSAGDATHAPELVAVISNQRAHPQRLAEYGLRMHIEQSFRDDKTGGFDIEHTRLQHAARLERLLRAVALATVWCHELGEFVLRQGDATRRIIDPGFERELSLFQLGLRWLRRCLAVMLHALPPFRARLSPLALPPVGA